MGTPERRADLRIGDAERHQVADVLRTAAGEGRLEMDELDDRLTAVYAARTYADLVPITADLPVAGTPAPPVAPGPAGDVAPIEDSLALLSGVRRDGPWHVGATHQATAFLGGVELDLREAVFTDGQVVITANAILGGVDITVNASTRVHIGGSGILGAFAQAKDQIEPDLGPESPIVHIRGLAVLGGVNLTRKPMPGEERRRHPQLGH